MNSNIHGVFTMSPLGKMWDHARNILNKLSKCNQWEHLHQMSATFQINLQNVPNGNISIKY